MGVLRQILRTLLALTFIGGGVSHLVLGEVQADGYAAFANTALLPALRDLWTSFVMPNIRILTILLGIGEVVVGIGLALKGNVQRAAALLMLGFYAFLIVLGNAWVTTTVGEDLLKNRFPALLLALLTLPFAINPDEHTLVRAWIRLAKRADAKPTEH